MLGLRAIGDVALGEVTHCGSNLLDFGETVDDGRDRRHQVLPLDLHIADKQRAQLRRRLKQPFVEQLCRLIGDRVHLEGACVFYLEGEVQL